MHKLILLLGLLFSNLLFARTVDGEPNYTAVIMFVLFVGVTLFITYWASKKTHTAKSFYTAGGNITGLQNGLAISGDFMSAASFLGISGLVFFCPTFS